MAADGARFSRKQAISKSRRLTDLLSTAHGDVMGNRLFDERVVSTPLSSWFRSSGGLLGVRRTMMEVAEAGWLVIVIEVIVSYDHAGYFDVRTKSYAWK